VGAPDADGQVADRGVPISTFGHCARTARSAPRVMVASPAAPGTVTGAEALPQAAASPAARKPARTADDGLLRITEGPSFVRFIRRATRSDGSSNGLRQKGLAA